MSDQWTDRLSEYVDDVLDPAERSALEAHLLQCVACGAVVADLRRIVARAGTLRDRPPAADPWPAIAARIADGGPEIVERAPARTRRRWSFSLSQLAAAAVVLVTLSGGSAWLLHPGAPVPAPIAATAPSSAVPATLARTAGGADRPLTAADRSYGAAVADLERVLEAGRGRLDTSTVRVIERNLVTIDSAIAQARRAVANDTANLYLNSHLAETMQRKLELLRQAASLVSSVS